MIWTEVEEADTYFVTRDSAIAYWPASLSPTEKTALLTTAELDLIRSGRFGLSEDTTETDALKRAVYEQALFRLISPDLEKRQNLQTQGVTTSGVVKEKYDREDSTGIFIAERARAELTELDTTEVPGFVSIITRDD